MLGRRRKCAVCGLYLGPKPHTGPMHDRIRKARGGKLRRFLRRRRK